MESFGKCCALARMNSGYTQEQAAPLLGVVPRTLSAYECDSSPVPVDVVAAMIREYQADWIGYMYLKLTNKIGSMVLPNIQQRALSANILDLQVEMDQASGVQKDLARVGRDDQITPDEVPIFTSCIHRLKALCGSIYSIAYAASVQNEKPPVLAHRRLSN